MLSGLWVKMYLPVFYSTPAKAERETRTPASLPSVSDGGKSVRSSSFAQWQRRRAMLRKQQSCNSLSHTISRIAAAALAIIVVFAVAIVATPAAQAQTFTVIHNFAGRGDGAAPSAGLTINAAGDLYGTTGEGGICCGTVFKLRHSGTGWILTPLYSFTGGNDGSAPFGRVTIGHDGTLYGTTHGVSCFAGVDCGTVFRLRPPASAPRSALAPWSETVLYRFTGGSDGQGPQGDLTFDQSGNIYGTTEFGGSSDYGVVYQLTPSGGGWAETILYSFQDNGDGARPEGGVIYDQFGNLYGVFFEGGPQLWDVGGVYKLSWSGSGWMERTIQAFDGFLDGGDPFGGLIIDQSGNLFGTTTGGGVSGGGTVFELSPGSGGWFLNTLWGRLTGGTGPTDKLVMDAAGNLYGTTVAGGAYQNGSVFKLTRSGGGWTYRSLHEFTGGSDGRTPRSNLIFDANGNLYGTTSQGGTGACGNGCGVVFEITP